MRRTHSLNLAIDGAVDSVKRGTLAIPKGKAMPYIRAELTVPINNTSGGAVTLTTVQRLALLAAFLFDFKYGPQDAKRNPFQTLGGNIMRRIARFLMGSELDGFTSATTGLARSLPNAQTTNVVFTIIIPTGRVWFLGALRNLFALGRSQASTVELTVRRQTPQGLPAGIAINGAVTVDIYPGECSVKGDRYATCPEFRQVSVTDFRYTLDDGLTLGLFENTAAHLATALSRVNMRIDAESIHEDASPRVYLADLQDSDYAPAEADVSDEVTILYEGNATTELKDLPTGRPFIEQPAKNLAVMNLEHVYVPIASEDELGKGLVDVANNIRRKSLKAVSLNATEELNLPPRLGFAVPSMLTDEDDREHGKFAGLGVPYRGKLSDVDVFVPEYMQQRIKGALASGVDADDLAKGTALQVPGTSQTGRGPGNASVAFAKVQRFIAH